MALRVSNGQKLKLSASEWLCRTLETGGEPPSGLHCPTSGWSLSYPLIELFSCP